MMSEAPLDRDQQIEMMVNAAERHAAQAARWMADPQVKAVVAASPSEKRRYSYDESKHTLAGCA
jgi:hypothetical protein